MSRGRMVKRYAFDLDGTLCVTDGSDYAGARPIPERIQLVNAIYDGGGYVIIHTARGAMGTLGRLAAILEMTERQLADWGVRHHELLCKPFAHVYVDDRAMDADEFFNGMETNGEV